MADTDQFVKESVHSRNYLTHFNDKLRDKAITNAPLMFLTKRLQMLLDICLFSELGIPDDEIAARLNEYYPYSYLKVPATEEE